MTQKKPTRLPILLTGAAGAVGLKKTQTSQSYVEAVPIEEESHPPSNSEKKYESQERPLRLTQFGRNRIPKRFKTFQTC